MSGTASQAFAPSPPRACLPRVLHHSLSLAAGFYKSLCMAMTPSELLKMRGEAPFECYSIAFFGEQKLIYQKRRTVKKKLKIIFSKLQTILRNACEVFDFASLMQDDSLVSPNGECAAPLRPQRHCSVSVVRKLTMHTSFLAAMAAVPLCPIQTPQHSVSERPAVRS